MSKVIDFPSPPIFTGNSVASDLRRMAQAVGRRADVHRKSLVDQVDDLLTEGNREKIADVRKQLLFGVDIIDTWMAGQRTELLK